MARTVSPGLEQGLVHGEVGVGAGMGLDVGVLGTEERLGPVPGQVLHLVDDLVPAVVAASGVSLGVLVGQDRARRRQHRRGREVLRRDELQGRRLAIDLVPEQGQDLRVLDQPLVEGGRARSASPRASVISVLSRFSGSNRQRTRVPAVVGVIAAARRRPPTAPPGGSRRGRSRPRYAWPKHTEGLVPSRGLPGARKLRSAGCRSTPVPRCWWGWARSPNGPTPSWR